MAVLRKICSEGGSAAGYVQTFYGLEEIIPAVSGRIIAAPAGQGKDVVKGEVVALVQPEKPSSEEVRAD